jgi:hypothetical protein
MRIEMARWAIEVPPGWSVAITEDQRGVRLHFERGTELAFLHVLPVAEIAGTAQAETQLRRRVPLGTPEHDVRTLAGHRARVYHWRDDGHAIETWFVEASDVLRIDLLIADDDEASAARGRAAADAVLASFTWR